MGERCRLSEWPINSLTTTSDAYSGKRLPNHAIGSVIELHVFVSAILPIKRECKRAAMERALCTLIGMLHEAHTIETDVRATKCSEYYNV